MSARVRRGIPVAASLLTLVMLLAACGASAPKGKADGGTDGGTTDGGSSPCAAAGGSCMSIGLCGVGQGHLGIEDCGLGTGSSIVCCFPESSCGGAETFVCCSATATYRPYCVNGTLQCVSGDTKSTSGACP